MDEQGSGTGGGLVTAAADLLLGGACVACGRRGRPLCTPCHGDLLGSAGRTAAPAWPDPVPAGLVAPWAAGPYDAALRALVLAHKERGLAGLARPLGLLLATAASGLLADSGPPAGPLLLVPVPSRPSAVRARGRDVTWALVREAARALDGPGRPVVARRLLTTRPGLVDQAGLDAAQRATNLRGSMTCPSRGLRRLAHRHASLAGVVLCDDVVTTGATLVEGQRALAAVGLPVLGAATVAATRRRRGSARRADR